MKEFEAFSDVTLAKLILKLTVDK